MRVRSFVGCAFALALISSVPCATTASAQEPAKPPKVPAAGAKPPLDPLSADLEALHKSASFGQWKQGVDQAAAIFRKYAGDGRVVARLDEIEEDLRTCVYRGQRKPLDPLALIGHGARKYSLSDRNVEFRFGPDDHGKTLTTGSSNVGVLEVPLEASTHVAISLETGRLLRAEGARVVAELPPACFFCYDTETQGGYVLNLDPESVHGSPERVVGAYHASIERIGPEKKLLKDSRKGDFVGVLLNSGTDAEIKYSRSGNGLSVSVGGKKVVEAIDYKYVRGLIGLTMGQMRAVKSVTITGKVDATYARRIESEAETARYRKWLTEGWKRETYVPAWALEAEKRPHAAPLPSDAPPGLHATVMPLMARVQGLDPDPVDVWKLRKAGSGAPKLTAAYLFSLCALADGDWQQADAYLHGLLGDEPGFGPGWITLVRIQLARGRIAEASATLVKAKAAAPRDPQIWEMFAAIEMFAGRMDGVEAALDEAAKAGVVTPWARSLRRTFLRARRGPEWQRRFDVDTPHYKVSGDASVQVCSDVGKVLEEANASYKEKFRPHADGAKAQVWVFSGIESYLDYTSGLGVDVTGTLGVYIPRLRALCVYLHEDRNTLWDTVRHEGFHQYVHQFAEDVPIWFNEGYAEYFGFVRKRKGKHVTGIVDDDCFSALRQCQDEFVPLAKLFRMGQAEFMSNPGPRYVQSWAAVHFLRETKDPALKDVLARYFDAVVAGKSRHEAFDEVMKPVMANVDSGFKEHVFALLAAPR